MMNHPLDNLVLYNGYPLSVAASAAFHALMLILLIWFYSSSGTERLELVQPTIIKALFIDENPQVVERRRLERMDLQRQAAQEQARLEEERRREQQEQERQREAEERERAQLLEREQLERQRAREEEERRERERLEAEQQRERELAEAERRREQQEQERLRQQAQEESQQQSVEAARTEFELVQSATALIQRVVQDNWSRPPSARNGMRAVLQIRMLPTGELLDAGITTSSGDPAFDRAAENAVYRAAPFTELQSLPIDVFNANFRSLSLIFQPEDLLN